MKPPVPNPRKSRSELDAPARPELRWIRWCLIFLLLVFAAELRPLNDGRTPVYQLGISLLLGGAAGLIGIRHWLVRPGAYFVLSWFGVAGFVAASGLLRDREAATVLESLQFPILTGIAMIGTHVAACAGMRATEATRTLLIAAAIGLLWQLAPGFSGNGIPVLEPLIAILLAGATASSLLRRNLSRRELAMLGLASGISILVIVRGISVPILIPAIATAVCVVLGSKWRLFPRDQFRKRITLAGIPGGLGVLQLSLTGFGGLTPGSNVPVETAALAGLAVVVAFVFCLRAAWRNSETVMGRWAGDIHLAFLPIIAVPTLASTLLTGSHFGSPLSAVLLGALLGAPQFFFNRAYYLRHRENEAAITPQLILNEDELPDNWEGIFPSSA